MEQKRIYLWLSLLFIAGAVVQKFFWGGSWSFGLIAFSAVFAYCSFKEKAEN